MAIEWMGSSARHGVDQDDALHAMLNPLYHTWQGSKRRAWKG
jgi:hypothetical protein